MIYEALQAFTGIIGGVEIRFATGEQIDAAKAKEMGLADKPELAKAVKK